MVSVRRWESLTGPTPEIQIMQDKAAKSELIPAWSRNILIVDPFQMHGYPDMVPPPGCRPLPPGHPPGHPPPPDMMYGPPPDHLLPPHHQDHLNPPDPDSWTRDGGPGTEIFPPREGDYSYLDTSDDSGRHTGPDQPSP